jgi:hypothetical protein
MNGQGGSWSVAIARSASASAASVPSVSRTVDATVARMVDSHGLSGRAAPTRRPTARASAPCPVSAAHSAQEPRM